MYTNVYNSLHLSILIFMFILNNSNNKNVYYICIGYMHTYYVWGKKMNIR